MGSEHITSDLLTDRLTSSLNCLDCSSQPGSDSTKSATCRGLDTGESQGVRARLPVRTVRLTCWTLQCWTVSAVSLTTPGSSFWCCSQQRDRSRPGWADMADRKMDWWRAACRPDSVGAERQTGQGHSRRHGNS